MPDQTAAAPQPQLPVDVRVCPGPDGHTPWVVITFQDQLVSASVRLDPAAADLLAAGIAGALRKAAVEARRQASPLVIASDMPATSH